VVSNLGPSAVTGASVSDPLPTGVTSATWIQTASSGGGTVTGPTEGIGTLATTVDLPVNATITFRFTVQIDPSATGSLVNTATVTPPDGTTDPNPVNNSATDTNALTPQSDLSITKTNGVESVVPGGSTTYTIVVRNNGSSTAVDQKVEDRFAPEFTASWTAVASPGSSVAATSGTGDVVTTVTLLPGGSVTFIAVAQINPAATGTLTNTATVMVPPGDNTPEDNTATDVTSLTPLTGLTITKTDNTTTAVPGTSTTYTIVVSNAGPSNATGVTLSGPLPAGVTSASWTVVGATDGGSVTGPTSGTGALDTTINVPVGATLTFSFTVQIDPTATGTLVNTATATPPGGTPVSGSDTDQLIPQADLSVTKDDGKTTAVPGTPNTYTITVTNSGPSTVSSVILTDTVPTTLLNPVFGTPSEGSYDAATGVWSGLSLASGQSATITLTGTIDPMATGSLTNTVRVDPPAGVTDPNTANNNGSDTDTLTPQADLAITKSDSATSVVPGGSTTYTIVVSNTGPSAVTGASVSDPLPQGVTSASWAFASQTGGGSVTGPSGGTGALATTVDLPVGASITFTFTVHVSPSATGTLTNTATVTPPAGVTDTNLANNSASDTDTLTPQADLAITKTDGKTSAVPGTFNTYTIVVSNNGLSAVTGATVSDPLPQGVTFAGWVVTARSGGGRVTGPASGIGALSTTVDLPVGATVTFNYTVLISPSATGTLTNRATVTPPTGTTDPNPANNSATDTDTLTPQADLFVTKTDNTLEAVPGSSTTYVIVVHNHGPSAVTGAALTDPLPVGVTGASWAFVTATGGGTVSGPTSGAGALATTVDLPVLATVTFFFTVQIDPAATGALYNTATITAPAGVTDTIPANNSNTDRDNLTPAADLGLVKTVNDAHPNVGETIIFTVTLTNHGPSQATGVIVTDVLPPGLTFVPATPSDGTYDSTSGVWTVGTVTTTTPQTLQIQAVVVSPNDETNTVIISHSDQPDFNPSNNQASVTVMPGTADVSVIKQVNQNLQIFSMPVTYTIIVHNNGPSTATGVITTDTLPARLMFVSATASQGLFDPQSGLWSIGTLANGASATLQITDLVAAIGPITNTASVEALERDPNLSNNTSSVTIDGLFAPGQVSKSMFLSSNNGLSNAQMLGASEAMFTALMQQWMNLWDALLSVAEQLLADRNGPGNGGIPVFEGSLFGSPLVVYEDPFAAQVTAVQLGATDFLFEHNTIAGIRQL